MDIGQADIYVACIKIHNYLDVETRNSCRVSLTRNSRRRDNDVVQYRTCARRCQRLQNDK